MDTIIRSHMIRWARERADLSVSDLAEKLDVTEVRVSLWESGKKPISMGHAERLAKLALVPLGVLFADEPPNITLPIPDYRTQKSGSLADPSPELLETILDAQEKQDWYREFLLSEGQEPLSFVGKESLSSSPSHVAKTIYKVLGLTDDWRQGDWKKVLSFLINKAEDAGIVVLLNGIVRTNTHRPLDVGEFRGFVLTDEVVPLVFINGRDAKSAQMFTLIHEIAHILLGQSALVDAEMDIRRNVNKTELFCNQVAAEFLTPKDEYVLHWSYKRSIDENLDLLSKHFKVSRLVCISRAFQLDFIDWPTRQKLWGKEMEEIKLRKRDSKGGDFHESQKFRTGRLIAQAVISEVHSNRMLFRDAFRLLGVSNVKSLRSFAQVVGGTM